MAGRNPFRSEAEAYRFLLLTVAAFAAITVASLLGGPWAGVPVFVVVTTGAAYFYLRKEPPEPATPQAPRHVGAEDEKRILVVANETVAGRRLRAAVEDAAAGYREQVLVVAPALNSPIRHWASDEDEARADAQKRVDASVGRLAELGIQARGEVGDSDPVQAIEDALRTFGADEIIISTHPEGRSNWLERGVVAAARERFAVPITHVVVDLEAEAEQAG